MQPWRMLYTADAENRAMELHTAVMTKGEKQSDGRWTPPPRALLTRDLRRRLRSHVIDESWDVAVYGVAIYSLSDPRDVRNVRYIGQTRSPRRRLLQHLNGARLWMPDELPWWIDAPTFKPLHEWLRALFRDDGRLPLMVVSSWVEREQALLAERMRIHEVLDAGLPLLNVQIWALDPQLQLLQEPFDPARRGGLDQIASSN
jgi:hypothetical protein